MELAQRALTHAERGELNVLLSRHLNTESPKFLDVLYSPPPAGWGLPKRFIKEGSRNTERLARSVDALLANYRLSKSDRRLELALLLSDRKTQLEALHTKLDKDGRVRFSLNVAGTKVGRMASQKSPTGSGYNMQTVTDRHRCLFPADPGHDLYSIDLKGADGWTIGAECAQLGDSRMLDDLRAGLKPANAVLLLWTHGPVVNDWPMERLLAEQAKLDKKHWRYHACKSGIWGTAYGEGDVTLAENLLEESWKGGELVSVSAADCKRLQAAVHARYPGIRRRMERINMLLKRDGGLTNCAGVFRDFFGPKTDARTQRNAYAYTPAFNTAYANNMALLRLWSDEENIGQDGERRFKPRLPVHDSILGVAPITDREWVASRIPRWFANPLTIAGTTLTIPYEAQRGPGWGSLTALA